MENKKVNPQNGLFISFEGIDGSGKTLQAETLIKKLRDIGYLVTLVRDPGGTSVSEQIREILLDRNHYTMTPVTELLLYEAARSQLVAEIILPTLEKGQIVLSDRFTDSTVAYQGYGRSLSLSLVEDANRWACRETFPHRTYILDIPWEESLRRRSTFFGKADRMENEQTAFYKRVREGYQKIAKEEPNRVRILDGTKTVKFLEQEIFQDVLSMIDRCALAIYK